MQGGNIVQLHTIHPSDEMAPANYICILSDLLHYNTPSLNIFVIWQYGTEHCDPLSCNRLFFVYQASYSVIEVIRQGALLKFHCCSVVVAIHIAFCKFQDNYHDRCLRHTFP